MLELLRDKAVGTVGRGTDGVLGADELWRNAAALAARLPEPTPDSMVTFSFGRDRSAFVTALLGSWLAGHGVALPESSRRDHVASVMALPEHVELLHDTGIRRGIDVAEMLATAGDGDSVATDALRGENRVGDPDRVLLATHTTGADGCVHVREFTAEQLRDEVLALAEDLELAADQVVVHELSPMFELAVLAGVLAPMAAGGAFELRMGSGDERTPERLTEAARDLGARVALCSGHMVRALAGLPSGALGVLDFVGCHGEPPAAAAHAIREHHGVAVGAVLAADPVADIAIDAVDRLLAVEGIDDAGVVRVGDSPVALVGIVGPESGLLSARAAAAAAFDEAVELVVRTVPVVQRDANGRIAFGDFCASMGRSRDGGAITRELRWRAESGDDPDMQQFRTSIPANYAFFAGHFMTYPVLAGGVQLQELVLPCVRAANPGIGALQRLDAVKFLARIAPGDEIVVQLRGFATGERVTFEIWCADTRCTSGKLRFAAAVDPESVGPEVE